ncbi:MAG: TlpA disulfide reductase family protein [Chitinophagales bacterium]
MKNKLLIGLLLVIGALTGLYFYNKYNVAPRIKFNTVALTDLKGQPVQLADFKAKRIFVNFFGTWCGPCMAEMPSILRAYEKLHDKGFVFLIVSDEPLNRLQQLAEANPGLPLVLLHSAKRFSEMDIYSIPVSYVLNAESEILYKKSGSEQWDSEAMLAELEKLD